MRTLLFTAIRRDKVVLYLLYGVNNLEPDLKVAFLHVIGRTLPVVLPVEYFGIELNFIMQEIN